MRGATVARDLDFVKPLLHDPEVVGQGALGLLGRGS
jgi:hypothetical protein